MGSNKLIELLEQPTRIPMPRLNGSVRNFSPYDKTHSVREGGASRHHWALARRGIKFHSAPTPSLRFAHNHSYLRFGSILLTNNSSKT